MSYHQYTKKVILLGIVNLVIGLKFIILLPILTKNLGSTGYGIWSQILVTVQFFSVLAMLQLNSAMVRFIPPLEVKGEIRERFYSMLYFAFFSSLLFAILLYFSSPLIIMLFFSGSGGYDLLYLLRLSCLIIVVLPPMLLVQTYFRAFQKVKYYSFLLLFENLGFIALVSLLIGFGMDLKGVILASILIRILVFAFGEAKILASIGFCSPRFKNLKSDLIYSIPLLFTSFLYLVTQWSDRYVIGFFLPIQQVGIYSANYTFGSIIFFIFLPVFEILMPQISKLWESKQLEIIKTYLSYSIKFPLIVAIPCIFGSVLYASRIMKMLSTSEFVTDVSLIIFVMLGYIFLMVGSVFAQVIFLIKKTRISFYIHSACALFNLITNFLLIPRWGIIGAAATTAISFLIHLVAYTLISRKYLRFQLDIISILKSVLSSLIMIAIISFIPVTGCLSFILAVLAGIAIYGTTIFVLKGFSKKELLFFKDLIFKPRTTN